MTLLLAILGIAGSTIVALFGVPVVVVLLETLAFGSLRRRLRSFSGLRPRLAVIMPAHDEARGIREPILGTLAELELGDRLLVVADNCTDATAEVARAAGAEVVERNDSINRGKGYALAHGMRALDADPPEVVVILDADCFVEAGSLARLGGTALSLNRPVQALYLMRSPPGAGPGKRIAEFAWVVKNLVRPGGAARLGIPCHLMGTGMALPWEIARQLEWASGHLVEDMELGVNLALAGKAPVFLEDALVTSSFPTHQEGTTSQRTRWEHGHFSVIASHAPRLLAAGISRARPSLVLLALDLAVPPLAALVLLLLLGLGLGALLAVTGITSVALVLAVLELLGLALAVAFAWCVAGRNVVSLGELIRIPAYVVGKLPIYAKLFGRSQTEWVRTERERSDDQP